MYSEISVIDSVTWRNTGHIEVRKADIVLKDGVEIAKTYHRHVVSPGDPLDNEDESVVAIANALWTPELIAAYVASIEGI